MSFFTSLTGLNAATTQLSVTSNNIANAGTTGFKRSRSDFGDIFATSPLQKASTVVGQGTALKQVTQEFSQGNIELSGNSLDLAVTGEGFFPLRSADGQDLFTRNGSFLLDEQNTVVNSAGQYLKVASVDSLGKADFKAELIPLTIAPKTVGEAIATSAIDFGINFPAESLPLTSIDENNLEKIKDFNPEDPSTYAKSAAITIFDENGNDFLLTFFYRRVGVASSNVPFNKWQTHVVLDGQEITPALGQATSSSGTPLFVDKYGNIVPEDELPVVLNDNLVFQKYNLDDLSSPLVSEPATAKGGLVELPYLSDEAGQNFAAVAASQTITVDRDLLASIGASSKIQLTLTAHEGGGVTSDTVLNTTTSARAHVGLTNQNDIESGDVASLKVQADGASDATVFTTATLPADATTAQVVASLNDANAVIELDGLVDLDADDIFELVLTTEDGLSYTYSNAHDDYDSLDATTWDSIASVTDPASLVALLSGPASSPFSLSSTETGIVVSQDIPTRVLDVTLGDLVNASPTDDIGFRISTAAGDSYDYTVSVSALSGGADNTSLTAAEIITNMGEIVAELNTQAAADGSSFSFSANAAGTKLIVTNAISGDDRFDVNNEFKIAFSPDHSVTDSTFSITWDADGTATDLEDGVTGLTESRLFKLAAGTNHAITAATVVATENISSSAGTAISTTATAFTNDDYDFSFVSDPDGNTLNNNLIEVVRSDGTNFKLALGSEHSLSGDSALFEHISADANQVTTAFTELTNNGSTLGAAPTVAEIVSALNKSAASTDYRIAVSATDPYQLVISKRDGTEFTLTVDEEPSGLSANLMSGLVDDALTALAAGDSTQISSDGVEAPEIGRAHV